MVKEAMALRAVAEVERPPHATGRALAARATRRKRSMIVKATMTETRITVREKRAYRRDIRAVRCVTKCCSVHVGYTWVGTCRKKEEVESCQHLETRLS